jgi:hypothetical protein
VSDARDPEPGRPAPGWHPDPLHRYELRYHNGRSWTADVAVGGERFVDPLGAGPTPMPPPGYALGPREPSTRASGWAIAALVLGVCAVAVAWLPFVFVAGVVAGILAIVFGLLGRREARRGRGGRGMATAGLLLGPLALGLAGLGFWLSTQVLDLLSPGDYTLVEEACEVDGSFARLEGTIRNDSDRTRSYAIAVRFLFIGTRNVIAGDTVTVRGVAPGETAPWTARARVQADAVECEVLGVSGALSFAAG